MVKLNIDPKIEEQMDREFIEETERINKDMKDPNSRFSKNYKKWWDTAHEAD